VARDFDPEHRLFKRALGGGAILDLGCYPVSFSRLIAGASPHAAASATAGLPFAEPVEFRATGRLHPLTQTDEYATAVAKFPGDIIAELSCGSTVVHDISARIYGTKGWLDVPTPFFPGLDGRDEKFFLHRHGQAAAEEFAFPCRGVALYAHEADAVGDALARGELESPAMTHADTLGNMSVLDDWRAQVGVDYHGI
jgi:predicted dehydrogenase